MSNDAPLDVLLRTLDWYAAVGVDAALGEAAIDWLSRGERRPGADFTPPTRDAPQSPATGAARRVAPAAAMPQPAGVRSAPPPASAPARKAPVVAPPTGRTFSATPPDAAVTAARAEAPKAETLEALRLMLDTFDGCGLKATAKSLCFYRGAARARVMVIGAAPAREEDLAGTPFVGPAGQLLDRMLAAIGLDDSTCHLTNMIYWRPPGNRTPTPQEIEVCRPFLDRQVALVQPEIVVVLGAVAVLHVLDVDEGIMRARGKWRDQAFGGHTVRALPTLHPDYLLRSPGAKQQAWGDLLSLKAALQAGR